MNSGKYVAKCECMIFSFRMSVLLRNRMTEERWNQGYVMIVLNSALLSSMRFCHKKTIVFRIQNVK